MPTMILIQSVHSETLRGNICHNLTLTSHVTVNEFNLIRSVVCILFVRICRDHNDIGKTNLFKFFLENQPAQCRLNRKLKQKMDPHHIIRAKIRRLNIKCDPPLENHFRFRVYERLSTKRCCKYSMVSKQT